MGVSARFLAPVVACVCLAAPASAADPALETAAKQVEKAAAALAKGGRKAEVKEAVALLADLGRDEASRKKTSDACDRSLAKAARQPAVPDAAKSLRQAAADLAATLPSLDWKDRTARAALALRLDGENEAAHKALGHVREGSRWLTAEQAATEARRKRIAEELIAARKAPLETAAEPSRIEIARTLVGNGKPLASVIVDGLALHSVHFDEASLRRMAEHVARGRRWARRVRLPDAPEPAAPSARIDAVLCGREPVYLRFVDDAAAKGLLTKAKADVMRRVCASSDPRGFYVSWGLFESDQMRRLLYHVLERDLYASYGDMQPALQAGFADWCMRTWLGLPIPGFEWVEEKEGRARSKTSDHDDSVARTELQRLSERGIVGARSWLRYLAIRGEDPAFARAAVSHVGEVRGVELLKCVFVVEYLAVRGEIDEWFRATDGKPRTPETLALAAGGDLADFEARWRAWFLPADTEGLAQRCGAAEAQPPGDVALLAYLDAIRTAAVPELSREALTRLRLDEELSAACGLHARYLAVHKDQQTKWPDAHEQYPDRAGYTPEGCRAGMSAVIAPGVKTWREAVDGWMGTFYHRLPLTDPELLRIGFALEGGTAVLDCATFVASFPERSWAAWPPPGGRDVPLRFNAELPNPVPGEDQSKWGYPVTLQLIQESDEDLSGVSMELLQDGAPVPCWISSPGKPTNPDLAPEAAWCLIPKQTLRPATTYTVSARGLPRGESRTWTFTTGR
ncbi:MAG: hypothetical protein HMLKMBBP_03753 [Planctomycetes bacterium]|nr:hypothetical protein [Planctomycetota bacterium]